MLTGIIAFVMISKAVAEKTDGGSGNIIENVKRATEYVEIHKPERLVRGIHPNIQKAYYERKIQFDKYDGEKITWDAMVKEYGEERAATMFARPGEPVAEPEPPKPAMSHLVFITFLFIPLSVGMFPHVFQHWLTAKSAKSFRLAIVAHPICIAIVWLPCILIGVWAAGLAAAGELTVPNSNATLGVMVGQLVDNPWLMGLLMAGVLAAIMSSLDSQFACLGTMFTNDIVIPIKGEDYYSDADKVKLARCFVVGVVAVAYVLSLLLANSSVFNLGVWCFSGFTALFPILFAALYWKRVTTVGAYACIGVTTVLWFYWFQQSGWGSDKGYSVLGMLPAAPLTLASTTALIAGSLVSRPPENRLVNRFFPRASNDGRGGD